MEKVLKDVFKGIQVNYFLCLNSPRPKGKRLSNVITVLVDFPRKLNI